MNMMSVNLEKSEEILLKMEAKFKESNGEHNLSSTEQIPNQNFTEDA